MAQTGMATGTTAETTRWISTSSIQTVFPHTTPLVPDPLLPAANPPLHPPTRVYLVTTLFEEQAYESGENRRVHTSPAEVPHKGFDDTSEETPTVRVMSRSTRTLRELALTPQENTFTPLLPVASLSGKCMVQNSDGGPKPLSREYTNPTIFLIDKLTLCA